VLSIACWGGLVEAQHVIVLKNGRQITVQSYRSDGNMIKFSGLGGEIAISNDQVESIRPAGEAGVAVPPSLALERPAAAPPKEPAVTETKPAPAKPAPPAARPEEQLAKQRAEEEKGYVQKVKELTEQLRQARDQYSLGTRGNKGPEPSFFTTEEAFRGHQEDLLSRLRDAQNRAQGLETGSAAQRPPLALDPPPAYSDRQRELSDLRSRMNQLENDRQKLLDEMKAKNFDAGALNLE
jgi:hypothetical protein